MTSVDILREQKEQQGSASYWGINIRRNKKTDFRQIDLAIGAILGTILPEIRPPQ